MQTRNRVLQEWKKSFKVRLVFGHSKIPMEVRKPFKKDLRVPIMFTLQTIDDVIQVKEKFQLSIAKKLNFFSPMRSSFSFAFKTVYHRREEY